MSKSTGNEVNILASLGIKPLSKATNYREWRLAVIDILAEKGYWEIVSGKSESPDKPREGVSTDTPSAATSTAATSTAAAVSAQAVRASQSAAAEKWELKSSKARGMLGRLLDSAHRELYADVRDPKELWEKLEKRYAGKDQARIWFLREELSKVEYNDDDLVDYISRLEKLFHQLAAAGELQAEKDKKYLLLSKLPLPYHPFRTTTWNDSKYDETAYDEICDRLILEHQQLTRGDAETEATNAFYAGKGRKKDNGKQGQSARSCRPQTEGTRESVSKDSCFHCKEKGHWANKCPKKRQDKRRPSGFNRRGRGQNQSTESGATVNSSSTSPRAWTAMDEKSAKIASAKWVLDSGATHHMTSDRTQFQNLTRVQISISIANGATMTAEGEGDILLNLQLDDETNQVLLKKVLYVPEMGSSGLVSVRCIQAAGGVVSFAENTVSITHEGKLHGIARLQHNAYILQTVDSIVVNATENVVAQRARVEEKHDTLLDWHRCLGHISFDKVKQLADHHSEMIIDGSRTNPTCVSCIAAKQTRTPNSSPATRTTTAPLQLIHTDLAGPMKTTSLGGARYYVLFIDDYSRYTVIYILRQKSETFAKFREYKALVENYHDTKIKALRSDNGGEYTSIQFTKFMRESGISHEKTAPYSPEQNGVSERANRTLVGRAKAMILDGKMGDNLWAEAMHTAVYLTNQSPTRAKPEHKTPYELWTRHQPDLTRLIPFGTPAFYHIPKIRHTKWQSSGEQCKVVGYEGTNQYRVLSRGRITVTRDIRVIKRLEDTETTTSTETIEPVGEEELANTIDIFSDTESDEDTESLKKTPGPVIPTLASTRTRRETAGKFTSTRYQHEAYMARTLDPDEPPSYTEALESPQAPEWKQAIEEELKSVIENHTWELVELPKGRTPVKCRWTFRVKRGAGGEVIKYKARLVAKGFTQRYGIDYLETYAPVVKLTSLRIILALAAARDYEVDQTDIKSAYLLAKLDEEIYMDIPEGLEVEKNIGTGRKVCKLLKGLYGLKQSGRMWNQEWDRHLVGTCGFTRSKDDHAVYLKKSEKSDDYCWVLIWVDDVLWIGPRDMVDEAKSQLAKQFPVTDMGSAHFFLGIEIVRGPQKISLNQSAYIQKILERFHLTNAHTVSTPLNPGTKLLETPDTSDREAQVDRVVDGEVDETEYRSMIGSLMYLMLCTRPDIAFAVGVLSRYNNSPRASHWSAAKHLLRYVKKTAHLGLTLGPFSTNDLHPILYSDADWAGDLDTRRSTGGYVCVLTTSSSTGNPIQSAISWSSKRQQTVALSSTEAEYMALTQAAKEAIWVSRFLAELQGIPENSQSPKTRIYIDNQGSIALAHNPEFHARTKHIAIQEHYVREKVTTGEIELVYLHTGDMIADCLTKNLSREKVERFRGEMGLH